ncbi:uncharacterized protein LOC131429813 [Malaya genurostris]|uniref:uncharacterized protein LOC131429813 n=1 Tax=Malaya genurostris TaxID=325434 RepID=UPI0026F3948D|nr:uncharacterized protein LOC131429813 [Malaya genurostris]
MPFPSKQRKAALIRENLKRKKRNELGKCVSDSDNVRKSSVKAVEELLVQNNSTEFRNFTASNNLVSIGTMGRRCEFYYCNSNEGLGKSFYGFPTDEKLCAEWVTFCESKELTAIFKAGGVESLRKRRLCSDHFQQSDFKDLAQRQKGLRGGATPSYFTVPTTAGTFSVKFIKTN